MPSALLLSILHACIETNKTLYHFVEGDTCRVIIW